MQFLKTIKTFLNWFADTRFGRKFLDIFYETATLIFYVGAIALLHYFLDWWLGPNAKLLDVVPVRYIIDVGHMLAIGNFFLEILKHAIETIRLMRTPRTEDENG